MRKFSPPQTFRRNPNESTDIALVRLGELVNRLTSDLRLVLNQYTDRAPNDYVFLENVTVSTGAERLIEHKLGRAVRGYRITKKTEPADISDNINTTTADLTKFLPLVVSATTVISLEIF